MIFSKDTLGTLQERILTMTKSIQAKEAAWKNKEEKSLASLRAAQDRVASLQMALKIKEDDAGKALKDTKRQQGGESQVKALTVELKEEKSNLQKMGIIVKALEETIFKNEEKVELLQTENKQLKEKGDGERMEAMLAKAKEGEAVARDELKTALEAKLGFQKTIKNINGAKDSAEKKALKLEEKVSLLETTLTKSKTEVQESKNQVVDLKKEFNHLKKEMSEREEIHKEEVNLLKEKVQRGIRPPGPPGPPGPSPTDPKIVHLQKLNAELETKMKEMEDDSLAKINQLQKSNTELEIKLKEKEEISENVKDLEDRQTEGEMKLIEEIERGRKAENVKDKIIATLKAENVDFQKKIDAAQIKEGREAKLIESGNELMPSESQEDIVAKYEGKMKDVNQKLIETEESFKQKLFEKEDHFEREMEVLKRENKRIKEHLKTVGEKEERMIHNLEETRVKSDASEKLEARVEMLQRERSDLIIEMRQKEERLEELQEETDDLNKSIEVEKSERCNLESEIVELRRSVEGRVKRATVMHNLDMETLRSELERTRLQVKEAQEVGVAAYNDVFEEHDELLTKLRTIPSKKRKRLLNQMFKTKRVNKRSRNAGKSKTRLGSSNEEKTLQIDNQDIDISEILFEEEEKIVQEGKDDEQEAMLTQEEQQLAELEIELKAMDSTTSPPPRTPSPPLTEKDFAQALLATTPPSKQPMKVEFSKGSVEETEDDGGFSAPSTFDDLISALEFECS